MNIITADNQNLLCFLQIVFWYTFIECFLPYYFRDCKEQWIVQLKRIFGNQLSFHLIGSTAHHIFVAGLTTLAFCLNEQQILYLAAITEVSLEWLDLKNVMFEYRANGKMSKSNVLDLMHCSGILVMANFVRSYGHDSDVQWLCCCFACSGAIGNLTTLFYLTRDLSNRREKMQYVWAQLVKLASIVYCRLYVFNFYLIQWILKEGPSSKVNLGFVIIFMILLDCFSLYSGAKTLQKLM
ncbi:MAG: hypothetical protein GY928_18385 [Colwellia sp.]|nr:hypothetical protein [Colwellia sp.]